MSAATMPFSPWCVDYHRTMAATANVGNSIKRGTSFLLLAKEFWDVDRTFRSLLDEVERIREANSEELRNLTEKLSELNTSLNRVLDAAGKRGITNRTLINASIQSLRSKQMRLQDIIERLQLSLDPAVHKAIQDAMDEYTRGETVSLDSLIC